MALGRCCALRTSRRTWGVLWVCLAAIPLWAARPAQGQDYQTVPLGNGLPDSQCVLKGLDGTLNSTEAGDDSVFGDSIVSGPNGICETPLSGDDQRAPNGVVLNGGLPNAPIISAGTPGEGDNVCDDTIVPVGDDTILVAVGNSKSLQLCITPGPNTTIDSTPGGDDVLTGVICPGPDATFQTLPDPADEFPANSDLCNVCPSSTSCIIPGPDGVLQTSADPSDVLVPVILTGADGISQTTAANDDTQEIALGSGFDPTFCVGAGADGIAQTTLCGNGVSDSDENGISTGTDCEDGNTTAGDGCNATCSREFCGDGVAQPGIGEECDDGNTRNEDACLVTCTNARCGDGKKWRGVEECEPPNTATCDANCQSIMQPGCGNGVVDGGEACDDDNGSNKDDCLDTCVVADCGDGFTKTKGTPPFEDCDDGNTAPGDGCSPTCTAECGNGVINGACTEGTVGAACSENADCDTTPGAGDGVCVGETCDPGAAGLCQPGPLVCSNVCRPLACGNGEAECDEECDLGAANGVPGSGCQADCTRNLIGPRETSGPRECYAVWTLDQAPLDVTRRTQVCRDGDACDFDATAGQCTFRVGVCLNRTGVAGCTPGQLTALDIRLRVGNPIHAAAAEALTSALAALAPGQATAPDRCRTGIKRKTCSIPDDRECDTFFGAFDGACDVGTGVLFDPPLDPDDQVSTCTPGVDVTVPAGGRLRLPALVRRTDGLRDRDRMLLICEP